MGEEDKTKGGLKVFHSLITKTGKTVFCSLKNIYCCGVLVKMMNGKTFVILFWWGKKNSHPQLIKVERPDLRACCLLVCCIAVL